MTFVNIYYGIEASVFGAEVAIQTVKGFTLFKGLEN
jgi:hypothetical protein